MTREGWISYFETATDDSVEVAALLRGPSPKEIEARAKQEYAHACGWRDVYVDGARWARGWQPKEGASDGI